MRLGKIQNIHFVGIGGIGMSGIAEVLLNLGYKISGSDLALSEITAHLAQRGAIIYEGHHPQNVQDAEVLIYSSAVSEDNPEVKEAQRLKIPVIKRAEMLGELMRLKFGVAIAGTHGKTSTTSLTGAVLTAAGLDPTLIIGGKLRSLKTNARLGASDYMVAEVDEFDRSLQTIIPAIAIITNIEADHLECYNDLDDLRETFLNFANRVPFYGEVICCSDNEGVREILNRIKRRVASYGFENHPDITARKIEFSEGGSQFEVVWQGKSLGTVRLKIPGRHNILNALAAIAAGLELDVTFPKIREGLESFSGVNRRFEITGRINDILVVDDYAHHPTEIAATLRGAREGWPQRRLIAVFQPHLYSRTKNFFREFARSFSDADVVFITEIYPAREEPIEGVSGELIANSARNLPDLEVVYVPSKSDAARKTTEILRPGDMVITIGAGDVWRINEQLLQALKSKYGQTKEQKAEMDA
ncbi:MAG: UDP-N-acetylmuramate--L-alanine ligase [Calditrichia bacterium]